ncbi:MAG: branched-chain amino acid aminotransferase [Alphaproteobacteria bacterium]|nr:branched-chain amino acid aminotransferase [Alphaproteobacteria bacterium]MBV9061839.1 branched-chain amino acid aminotransferase [Alphaproteobacteria bacterium]MBV9913954.1 branched-chain amino acid aminotransferase [Nevskiaceae bacterium]
MAEIIPFDKREGFIWLDGDMLPWRDAKIHVLTHGLHYASSCFEGERAYSGRIYKLEDHTERLFESARILGMKIPFTPEQISTASRRVVEAQGFPDAYVRPVVFRGSEQMSVAAPLSKTHVAIAVWQWPSYFDPVQKMKGIRLTIADWKRPSPETIPYKSKAAGLYMICTLSKHAAEATGYHDALMYDYRGYIAEATGANVFFVDGGKLITPTADCFLDGITRRSVMELARARQIPVIERHIAPDELPRFSECFLTGTAAEVTPVSEIGAHRFAPGRITETLMNDYHDDVRKPVSSVSLRAATG